MMHLTGVMHACLVVFELLSVIVERLGAMYFDVLWIELETP